MTPDTVTHMTEHTSTQPDTFTLLAGDAMLTVAQYAEHRGKTIRTVRRWLADPQLVEALGAVQLEDRTWMIPADAEPTVEQRAAVVGLPTSAVARNTQQPTSRDVSRVSRPTTPATLEQLLQLEPAYLDLETASRLLGVPVRAIRRNREAFGAVPYGDRGRLVVPQAIVRRVAGVQA